MSSNTAALRREDSSRVDAALRGWRTETVHRRAEWDAQQEVAERANTHRRRTRARVGALGAGVFLSCALGAFLLGSVTVPRPAMAVGTTISPTVPAIGSGDARSPVMHVTQPAALELLGAVRSWRRDAGLWVQFDYAGSPLVLKWTDAAGAVAMEPTPCVNNLASGARRCYVGRTAARVQAALSEGAAPGNWTVSACRGETCRAVASYLVY